MTWEQPLEEVRRWAEGAVRGSGARGFFPLGVLALREEADGVEEGGEAAADDGEGAPRSIMQVEAFESRLRCIENENGSLRHDLFAAKARIDTSHDLKFALHLQRIQRARAEQHVGVLQRALEESRGRLKDTEAKHEGRLRDMETRHEQQGAELMELIESWASSQKEIYDLRKEQQQLQLRVAETTRVTESWKKHAAYCERREEDMKGQLRLKEAELAQSWDLLERVLFEKRAAETEVGEREAELKHLAQQQQQPALSEEQLCSKFRQDVAFLQDELRSREDELEKARRNNWRDLRSATMTAAHELEVWRRLTITGCATRYELRPRDALISIVQEMLWALTPGDHQGACAEARTLVVADVEQVENVNVWKRYCVKKEELSSSLRRRRELDRRDPQSALRPLKELHGYLDYITLRKDVNDVLLLYGTSSASAKNIVLQGFDDRLVGRQLYGHGVYFT